LKKGIELSLNEYEALLNKAAVGSGLPWGIAEDAAACGAWFMSCGINKLDTWIDRLKDNSFWIDYCKKIDQPNSNKLNNIFDLVYSCAQYIRVFFGKDLIFSSEEYIC